MIELFGLMTAVEHFTKKEHFENMDIMSQPYPYTWIFITLFIAFGTAYLAFSCNDKETPATRFVVTFFAFLFSGIYLVYYFIMYILLNKKCNGRDISDVMKKLIQK